MDYIGGNEFPFQLAKRVEKVTVIDHHKTAIEYFDKKEIPENSKILIIPIIFLLFKFHFIYYFILVHVNFAYDKSGATLALDHFSKEVDLFDGMHPAAKEYLFYILLFIILISFVH